MVFPVALFPVPLLPTSTVLRVSVEKKAGNMDDHGLIWGQFSKRCQMPWQRMLGEHSGHPLTQQLSPQAWFRTRALGMRSMTWTTISALCTPTTWHCSYL